MHIVKRSLAPWLAASVAAHAAAFAWAAHVQKAEPSALRPAPSEAVLSGGDTFEVQQGERAEDLGDLGEADELPASDVPSAAGAGEKPRAPARHARAAKSDDGSAAPATAATSEVFGADGERAAVDLSGAFLKILPQTASADAAWARAPFGPTGGVEVVLEIDEQGALVRADVRGPSGPLKSAAERTVVLLRHRLFTARARTTRLHFSAVVEKDEVHDGLHGDFFALGGMFFALPSGRRIDLKVDAR